MFQLKQDANMFLGLINDRGSVRSANELKTSDRKSAFRLLESSYHAQRMDRFQLWSLYISPRGFHNAWQVSLTILWFFEAVE